VADVAPQDCVHAETASHITIQITMLSSVAISTGRIVNTVTELETVFLGTMIVVDVHCHVNIAMAQETDTVTNAGEPKCVDSVRE